MLIRRCSRMMIAVTLFAAPLSGIALAPSSAPLVLYTDIASGPNSGGEHNLGAYLSIFGKNFGSDGLGSVVKVKIGGTEVANYRYIGPSNGRVDVQQITVQIGALTGVPVGIAQPVLVSVDNVDSNNDVSFTINPGRMLFVDNVHGNDDTAVPGEIGSPYKHVQLADVTQAAYGAMQPGDIIVMRDTGTKWTDLGNDDYFVKFIDKDASAPTGVAGTGPFTLMAYPQENVFINMVGDVTPRGGISGVDRTGGYSGGLWITIADLHIESGGNAGVIAVQDAGDHWRIVNNELTAATATDNALAGGINGNATNSYWVGNHVHDIAGGPSQENHGIYVDGDGSYEIAYNAIENVSGGNGVQVFADETDTASNVNMHHNIVHDVSKHGINIGTGSKNGIELWDNIVYNTAYASLRLDTEVMHGGKIYNNTFYNAVTSGNTIYGTVTNDSELPANALDVENNIIEPASGMPYTGGTIGISKGQGTITNNLWFGGTGAHAFDAQAVNADPLFVDAAGADFHLQANSPAINVGSAAVAALVVDDFDAVVARPVDTAFDIGAFEYELGYVYDRIFANGFD